MARLASIRSSGLYPTSDDRYISFVMMQPAKFWADVCKHRTWPRRARRRPRFAAVESIAETPRGGRDPQRDDVKRPLAEWSTGASRHCSDRGRRWDTLQVVEDAQVRANDYLVHAR